MEDILQRLEALETAQRRTERTLRFWRGIALGLLFLSLAGGGLAAVGRAQAAPGAGTSGFLLADLNRLLRRVSDVELIVARHDLVVRHFTPGAPVGNTAADGADTSLSGDVTLTGNLYIVNGLGGTATTNASGNLVVGYGEGNTSTGSHNIILGIANVSSSYAGLVAGSNNTISGPYATVTGGQHNTASATAASVSGGSENTASANVASVGGGRDNNATAVWASVSGGSANVANGEFASVSGGVSRTASGTGNWAAGGLSQSN